ncbi:MAG: L-2-hydroxyglutarate oxidase [Planctomycetota bacterium]
MAHKVDFDVVVIGGGIIGLAVAYKIARKHPNISLGVVEKENCLGFHQTGHNSGVIHSGIYYKPGSKKAKTCVEGRKELLDFASEHKIPFNICGKIIVANRKKELESLERVFENGRDNGIEGLEKIGPGEIQQIETSCRGIAAIKVPATGVIDFVAVCKKLAELITDISEKNRVLLSHEVISLERHDFFTSVVTKRERLKAKYIINCAGLQSDRIARMDQVESSIKIIPFRGDYYELSDEAAQKVKALIYPVPDLRFPFLGIHFTRSIDNRVECGPNAVFSFKREGYQRSSFSFKDTSQALLYPGTWMLFLKNMRYGLGEYARAFSKELFVERIQRMIPSVKSDHIRYTKSGVRAQAVGRKGQIIDDFEININKNVIHVLNAPSPAATASLAIGDHVRKLATEHFDMDS